jgi:hypothetical protein
LRSVDVKRAKDRSGYVGYRLHTVGGVSVEDGFRSVLVGIAGPAAERLITRQSWPAVLFGGGHVDYAEAVAELGSARDVEPFLPMAHQLVTRQRAAIDVLARVLAERHVLTGDDATAIIGDAGPGERIEWVRGMVPPDFPGYKPPNLHDCSGLVRRLLDAHRGSTVVDGYPPHEPGEHGFLVRAPG